VAAVAAATVETIFRDSICVMNHHALSGMSSVQTRRWTLTGLLNDTKVVIAGCQSLDGSTLQAGPG
jgi:hypothetical protein